MSAHGTNTSLTWKKGLAALTMSGAGIWLGGMATAAPATATEPPAPHSAAGSVATMPTQGPPNYPSYNPRYEVHPTPQPQGPPNYPTYDTRNQVTVKPVKQGNGQATSSATLTALGDLALGGAGLGITLGVQRRRKHSASHEA